MIIGRDVARYVSTVTKHQEKSAENVWRIFCFFVFLRGKTSEAMTGQRYISPYTDFGFKYIFGSELNKEYLISFLNALFEGRHNIKDVTYQNSEHLDEVVYSRRAIFDVYCTTDKGDHIIVEMQNVDQDYFADRMVYYSTFPIREQARRGDWDYKLNPVYTIGILNFIFDKNSDDVHHEAKLMNVATKEVFYDKLSFITIELPKFNKKEDELVTLYDKWLFVLRNLSRLMERPAALQERVFASLFRHAEIDKMQPNERRQYEKSLFDYNDINNSNVKHFREGKEEGLREGKEEGLREGKEEGLREGERKKALDIARKLKAAGVDDAVILATTGLNEDELNSL